MFEHNQSDMKVIIFLLQFQLVYSFLVVEVV